MTKEEKVKSLGFKSYDELLLYIDVCVGRSVNKAKLAELSPESILKTNTEYLYTKQDYDFYIQNNGLLELFNKVKDMPTFDRMIEIYVYYANLASMCKMLKKLHKQKLEEARELFDGEKEVEAKNEFNKYHKLELSNLNGTVYIEDQVKIRMPDKSIEFYDAIDNVFNVLLEVNRDSESQKKM